MSFLLNSYIFGGAPGALLAPLFTNSNNFFAPTVAPGVLNLQPGLFTDGDTFFVLIIGSPPLLPSLLTDGDTFFAPTVAPGVSNLSPPLLTNGNTFPVPDVHHPDADFASVVLLSGFEGSDGSTTLDDESNANRALTCVGDAQIDTAQFKFGASSLLLDGNGDRVTAVNSADFQFGSGAFTIEGFFRFAVNTTTQVLASFWRTTGNQRSWLFTYAGADATDNIRFSRSTDGSNSTVAATFNWTPTVGQWYHIAVDRSGDVFRLYIDGAMVGSSTTSGTLHNSTTTLRIGSVDSGGETLFFNGHIDELRITKSVARYGSDGGFTVPTAAYPRA